MSQSECVEMVNENINPQCCCLSLRKATRAVTQFYNRYLQSVGINSTQFTLLIALSQHPIKPLSHLSEELVMDRSTLVRNLKPLLKHGFIIEQQIDKRSKGYVLTFKGRQYMQSGEAFWEQAQDEILEHFGHEQYPALLEDLKKITDFAWRKA